MNELSSERIKFPVTLRKCSKSRRRKPSRPIFSRGCCLNLADLKAAEPAGLLLHIMITYCLYTALAGLALLPLFLYMRNPYFFQDLRYAVTLIKIASRVEKFRRRKPFYSILECFLDRVAKEPQKTFVLFEDSSYSYSQADKESNRAARALTQHAQLKEGDTAALLLGNEPQFVWMWLALAKLGCVASLLNFNIRSKSLLHCFSCCDAKVLVVGAGKSNEHLLHYRRIRKMKMVLL